MQDNFRGARHKALETSDLLFQNPSYVHKVTCLSPQEGGRKPCFLLLCVEAGAQGP